MNVEHDRQHDLAYFAFSSVESTRQLRLDPGRIVDYWPNDEVVGVEFISPSRGISLAGCLGRSRSSEKHGDLA